MGFRRPAAMLVVCLAAWAQAGYTVEQIKSFIHSAIQLKQPDKQVADYLRKMKLTERLDLATVETLQGEGAGPKTVAALKELAEESASLAEAKPPAPKPVYVPPPPPSSEEQARILADVKDYAMNYTRTLPDFICLQQTRRYVDPTGSDSWRATDVITARLSYFEQKEDYKLVTVNNRVTTDTPYTAVGGAISTGEFGSMMREIFDPASNTRFEWDRWGKLRNRMAHVFSYRVPLEYSKYSIHYQSDAKDPGTTIVVGYHGSIFVDCDTNMIVRITIDADNIPATFPVQQAKETLDYDFTKIGDRDFLLPLRADMRMRASRLMTKNVLEFRLYRKFSADANIKFDGADLPPLPEDQPQPPK